MAITLPSSSFPALSAEDREQIAALVDVSISKAKGLGRPAIAGLFDAVRQALHASGNRDDLVLETAADLDANELEAIIHGLGARGQRERTDGHEARAVFLFELRAALEGEQRRRSALLAALDRAMATYDTHPPRLSSRPD